MTAPDDHEGTDDPALRLLTIWSAGQGYIQLDRQPGMPTGQEPRQLGQYLAEALLDLAEAAQAVDSDDKRRHMELMHGVMTETFTIVRSKSKLQVLGTLASLAEILHAIVHGVVLTGCDIDDVHHWAAYLQESLDSATSRTDIIEGFLQLLAEHAAGES